MRETEVVPSDLRQVHFGPIHPAIVGPIKISCELEGEIITHAKCETGFIHRGIEAVMEAQNWFNGLPLCDRLDPEGAIFGELAYVLAVEELIGSEVAPIAQWTRVMLCELSRVSNHLLYAVYLSKSIGIDTSAHYLLRDRERALDLFELLSGSRFMPNALRFGGLNYSVTDGFLERVLEFCDLMELRLKEYRDFLTLSEIFVQRTKGTAILSVEMVKRYGLTGPNARAAGLSYDLRRSSPYSGYGGMDFSLLQSKYTGQGDVYDRFQVRMEEVFESLQIVRQCVDRVTRSSKSASDNRSVNSQAVVPMGEAVAFVESARGSLGCHVVSRGDSRPHSVRFSTPSRAVIASLSEVLKGQTIEDIGLIISSLYLGVAEADK